MFDGLYRRISLTAETIWLHFTVKLQIGTEKVYNYFERGFASRTLPLDIFTPFLPISSFYANMNSITFGTFSTHPIFLVFSQFC